MSASIVRIIAVCVDVVAFTFLMMGLDWIFGRPIDVSESEIALALAMLALLRISDIRGELAA